MARHHRVGPPAAPRGVGHCLKACVTPGAKGLFAGYPVSARQFDPRRCLDAREGRTCSRYLDLSERRRPIDEILSTRGVCLTFLYQTNQHWHACCCIALGRLGTQATQISCNGTLKKTVVNRGKETFIVQHCQ